VVTRGASVGRSNLTLDFLYLSAGWLRNSSENRVNDIKMLEVYHEIRGNLDFLRLPRKARWRQSQALDSIVYLFLYCRLKGRLCNGPEEEPRGHEHCLLSHIINLCIVNLHAFLHMRQRELHPHGVDPRQDPRCEQAPAVPSQPSCPSARPHPLGHRHPLPPHQRRRADVFT
jgi:hypothetical protein